VFVESRIPPEDQTLARWMHARSQVLGQQRITLIHGIDSHDFSFDQVGIGIDIPRTMEAALAVGREGAIKERVHTLLQARQGLFDIPLEYSWDMPTAQAGLRELAKTVRKEPVNAYLNLTAHARVLDIPGIELDIEGTIEEMMLGIPDGHRTFPVRTKDIPAAVRANDLLDVDVTKVVASFDTTFSTWGEGRGRSRNIELAATAIDTMVLKPGQEFSFNGSVGRRTTEKGYVVAPVIIGDETEPGIGGGVCQVASTLHAAALLGAMRITERWAHSRPSAYMRLGMDATVSYPSKDFRFVNSLPYSVILHLHFPARGRLRVEILGGDPVATAKYHHSVVRTRTFVRRIVSDSSLPSHTMRRKQKGIPGSSVVSLVEFDYGTRKDAYTYFSEYRPTPEVFRISPDFDRSTLPELPKGASGVEDRPEDPTDAEPTG